MSTIDPPARIAFIGLGNMGSPMAARLAAGGYTLSLHDTNETSVQRFIAAHGGTACPSLRDLTDIDAVITMLPDGKAVREVVAGPNGVASTLAPGTIVIDMSSSDPVGTRALAAELEARGLHLIDAPVSGGVRRAENGTLSVMVGGPPAAADRVRPVLQTMAKDLFLTGPVGSGHAMKALNNLVSAGGLWIATEALLIGRQFGLAPETMVDILNASTGRNNSTENKFKQFILSRTFASGFSLGLMSKDIGIAASLAAATGISAPFSTRCDELWRDATAKLGAGEDHTAITKFLEQTAAKD